MDYTQRVDIVSRYFSLINRKGKEELLNYLLDTDYFYAPASTRFHGNYEGGLADHSMNVYKQLIKKECSYNIETITVVGLLHDLCKINLYYIAYRNIKEYDEHGSKRDEKGWFNWVQKPYYTVKQNFAYPHSELSIIRIKQFMNLTTEEEMAIRWHMGFTEPKEHWNSLGEAFYNYPLALLLYESDLEATYFLDEKV